MGKNNDEYSPCFSLASLDAMMCCLCGWKWNNVADCVGEKVMKNGVKRGRDGGGRREGGWSGEREGRKASRVKRKEEK